MTSPAFFSEKYSNLAFEIIVLKPALVIFALFMKMMCGNKFCLITSHKYVFPEPVGPQKRDTLVFPKRLTCLKRKRLAALIAASCLYILLDR